jgi:hypothetical protein
MAQAFTMTSGRVGAKGRAFDCVDATGPRVGRETSGSEADHGTIGDEVVHGRVVATGARLRAGKRACDEACARRGSAAVRSRPNRGPIMTQSSGAWRPRVRGERRVREVGGRRGKNGRGSFLNKAYPYQKRGNQMKGVGAGMPSQLPHIFKVVQQEFSLNVKESRYA